ncbi:MAG TPA: phosphate--acyl-ACP acyltransferase, partial [Ruminiclostridium sp.]|nr:phosphate--acyl-ACP acyltransferase [Ruminiclostridium sp.]
MKIIVDGFGGDNAPAEVIKGCRQAADEYNVEISIVGNKGIIEKNAGKMGIPLSGISIIHADDVMTMEDSPRDVLKSKSGSSMAVGLKALAEGQAEAIVSAA